MPLKAALHIRPQSIVFATDFSFESERAMRHAAAVARHFGSTLHMAHIVCSMGLKLVGPEAVAVADDIAIRDLHSFEHKLAIKGLLDGVAHDCIVRDGEVWPQIRSLIDELEADMIVIGTHGRRGLGRLLLGSVAEEIIRRAECPVLTVGPDFTLSGVENTREPHPILLATDFQPASLQAIPYVASFASERGVPLILLHVIPLIPHRKNGDWSRSATLADRRHETETAAFEKLNALIPKYSLGDGQVECVVRCGETAEEIVKLARELNVDAIAMGLHRSEHPEAVTHFRHTIACDVICHARCAVLTVRN
ncbi:UspA [Candidatus Koribacter versatilis Ellin345]|uniref:UspA n=1 Tax=Koribacter versatilis (strain Ellin345) TaxID=204669 RepID=Q1IVM4_KORVE|nr:universal stress protein [Candidatus Koribacter versatilis]ABF39076.1 UspA [Candidatus Koribacter versatilis Ellin345]